MVVGIVCVKSPPHNAFQDVLRRAFTRELLTLADSAPVDVVGGNQTLRFASIFDLLLQIKNGCPIPIQWSANIT